MLLEAEGAGLEFTLANLFDASANVAGIDVVITPASDRTILPSCRHDSRARVTTLCARASVGPVNRVPTAYFIVVSIPCAGEGLAEATVEADCQQQKSRQKEIHH